MRVLALMTDLYGVSGGIAEYNRFFIKALSENSDVEKIVALPRRSRQQTFGSSINTFEDDVTPTAEPTALSLPPRRGEDDVTPTAEPTTLEHKSLTALSFSQRRESMDPPVKPEDDKKVTVLKVNPNKWQYALSAMAALMTKGPFDLIWCGHVYMTPLAALLAVMARAKFWLQIHGVDAWQRPSRIVCLSVRSADRVLCVSRYTRKRFLSWANLAPEKVKVLPNTYNGKRFYVGETKQQQFNSGENKIILTVGRLTKSDMYKGHDTVISLLPELLKKDPSWVYWIAGEGDDLSRLAALAHDEGVEEQVKFLGFVKDEDLPDLYRTANVFIMLSKGEGFGIVYLEAMACGLPVIAARGDGSADPLLDGRAGRLVDANCLVEVMTAIEQSCAKNKEVNLAPRTFRYENFSNHLKTLSLALFKTPSDVA